MGADKAALKLNGATMADRAAAVLLEACPWSFEVGPGHTGLDQIRDGGEGPLSALATAGRVIDAIGEGGSAPEFALVLAVDMPFVGAPLLRVIGDTPGPLSAVPMANGKPQFLCARYSWRAVKTAETLVAAGHSAMASLTSTVPIKWLEAADYKGVASAAAFKDLDTPADLESARS